MEVELTWRVGDVVVTPDTFDPVPDVGPPAVPCWRQPLQFDGRLVVVGHRQITHHTWRLCTATSQFSNRCLVCKSSNSANIFLMWRAQLVPCRGKKSKSPGLTKLRHKMRHHTISEPSGNAYPTKRHVVENFPTVKMAIVKAIKSTYCIHTNDSGQERSLRATYWTMMVVTNIPTTHHDNICWVVSTWLQVGFCFTKC